MLSTEFFNRYWLGTIPQYALPGAAARGRRGIDDPGARSSFGFLRPVWSSSLRTRRDPMALRNRVLAVGDKVLVAVVVASGPVLGTVLVEVLRAATILMRPRRATTVPSSSPGIVHCSQNKTLASLFTSLPSFNACLSMSCRESKSPGLGYAGCYLL